MDGSFVPAKKRGAGVGKTKRGKGTKWMVVVDGKGIPLGGILESASPAEVTLAERSLDTIRVPRTGAGRPKTRPKRVIADKAYDSDPLLQRLKQRGIVLFSPHRRNRKGKRAQQKRMWRRYGSRWIVERTFSWIGRFKRLIVRCEHHLTVYSGFFHIACIMIALRRL